MRLPANVRAAIKSGPVPNLGRWRAKSIGNLTRGERVMRFIEEFLRVPEGEHVGQPFKLLPFQQAFVVAIYDNPHNTTRAYLSMGRKNGKTALIGALMLAHIIGPEARKNSQIVSGAMSRDQAALVFRLSRKMLELEDRIRDLARVVPSTKQIFGLASGVEYVALSADAKTAYGTSPIVGILDEVGQIVGPTSDFVDSVVTGQGAHGDNRLLIAISTSAASDADLFSVLCDDAQTGSDPHTVCHIYAADPECDILDETQWAKANPALGVFRSVSDLRETMKRAERIPAQEASARNLLLNQRVALESKWIAPSAWKACSMAPDMEAFKGRGVAIGIDMSLKDDLTAAVLAVQDADEFVHLHTFAFTPLEGVEARAMRDRAPYGDWIRQGYLHANPGPWINVEFVARKIKAFCAANQIKIGVVAYDAFYIELFERQAADLGLANGADWKAVQQNYRGMTPCMETFEELLLTKKIRHGSHPLLNMAAANAIAEQNPAGMGDRRLNKKKSWQKIDPLVAAVMAVQSAVHPVSPALSADQVLFV